MEPPRAVLETAYASTAAPTPQFGMVPAAGAVSPMAGASSLRDDRSEGGQSDGRSSTGSHGSSGYEDMTKEQRTEAKRIIKDFVKSMVKGRQLHVVLASGQVRTVLVSLSRKLDVLKIKANQNDKQVRSVPLASVDEIIVGQDAGGSAAVEGLETPLDDLSVTLALTTQECITFRMPDMEARDTLVMCFTMFSNEARQKAGV